MQPSFQKKTLFVVGNGPSLKGFDFKNLLEREWLGMNAAYRHWDLIGQYPTYYTCLDRTVGLSHCEAIRRLLHNADSLGIERFLLDDAVADAVGCDDTRVVRASDVFTHDPNLAHRVTTGSHSLLWAAQLGYRTITLLGVDQNYQEDVVGLAPRDKSRLEVIEATNSPNYYFSDYQQVGDALNRPNPVPHVHASAWRRVMRRMATDYPETAVYNVSPYSIIPGTKRASFSGVMGLIVQDFDPRDFNMTSSTVIDVSLNDDVSICDALHQIAPQRFCEVSYSPDLKIGRIGFGWRIVSPQDATNDGRWHIHIGRFEHDPFMPKIGSVLFLPPETLTGLSAKNWMPRGACFFDHITRMIDVSSGHVRGVLALRFDEINPDWRNGLVQSDRGFRRKQSLRKLFWRVVRQFDTLRLRNQS